MDRGTSRKGLMRRSHVTKICSESSYRRDAILKRPDCDAVCAYGNSVFHRNGERRVRCWIINQSPPSRACQSVSTWKLLLPHLVLFSIFLSFSDEEKHFHDNVQQKARQWKLKTFISRRRKKFFCRRAHFLPKIDSTREPVEQFHAEISLSLA